MMFCVLCAQNEFVIVCFVLCWIVRCQLSVPMHRCWQTRDKFAFKQRKSVSVIDYICRWGGILKSLRCITLWCNTLLHNGWQKDQHYDSCISESNCISLPLIPHSHIDILWLPCQYSHAIFRSTLETLPVNSAYFILPTSSKLCMHRNKTAKVMCIVSKFVLRIESNQKSNFVLFYLCSVVYCV